MSSPQTIQFQRPFIRSILSKAQSDKGFTLVELLVVVIIIGILSAIAVPAFINQAKKAAVQKNNTLAMDNARACAAAIVAGDTYSTSGGVTPATCSTAPVSITANTETTRASAATAAISSDGAVSLSVPATAL